MKTNLIQFAVIVLLSFITVTANAQSAPSAPSVPSKPLTTYLIERDIKGASKLSPEQLKAISQTSCGVLKTMQKIEWVQSYVAGDKVFCVYRAENEDLIREHAKKGGFPITSITPVANIISPATATN